MALADWAAPDEEQVAPDVNAEPPMRLAQATEQVLPGLSTPAAPVAAQAQAQPGVSDVRADPQAAKNDHFKRTLNFFRDPERLKAAALAAASARRPDMLQWLKRGYEAQKENTGEALAKVISGDTQGALEIFNANGDMMAKSIEPGSKKGLYKITMQDGRAQEIDPEKELLTLVTPPQMLQHLRNEEANAIRLQLGQGLIDARNTATTARSEAEAA